MVADGRSLDPDDVEDRDVCGAEARVDVQRAGGEVVVILERGLVDLLQAGIRPGCEEGAGQVVVARGERDRILVGLFQVIDDRGKVARAVHRIKASLEVRGMQDLQGKGRLFHREVQRTRRQARKTVAHGVGNRAVSDQHLIPRTFRQVVGRVDRHRVARKGHLRVGHVDDAHIARAIGQGDGAAARPDRLAEGQHNVGGRQHVFGRVGRAGRGQRRIDRVEREAYDDRVVIGCAYRAVAVKDGLVAAKVGVVIQRIGLVGVDVPFQRIHDLIEQLEAGKGVVQRADCRVEHEGIGQFKQFRRDIDEACRLGQVVDRRFLGIGVEVADQKLVGGVRPGGIGA